MLGWERAAEECEREQGAVNSVTLSEAKGTIPNMAPFASLRVTRGR